MCTLPSCGEPAAGPPPHDPAAVRAALANAAVLFGQRGDLEKLSEAAAEIERVRDKVQRNYEVEWQLAKYNYFLGKSSPDEAESSAAFERGREAGKIASRIAPDRPEGHFWFAANLGELARKSPITVGLRSVDEIKEAMHRVIEIDPGYQGGSAFDALGQVELATRLNGGSAEKAVEYLERGLAVNNPNANIRLHLAEAYLALRRDRDARAQLEELFRSEPHPDYQAEHEEAIKKGREIFRRQF